MRAPAPVSAGRGAERFERPLDRFNRGYLALEPEASEHRPEASLPGADVDYALDRVGAYELFQVVRVDGPVEARGDRCVVDWVGLSLGVVRVEARSVLIRATVGRESVPTFS